MIATATANGTGSYVIPVAGPLQAQTYRYSVQTLDQYGDVSSPSSAFALTIVAAPTTPSAPRLLSADDSGTQGDGITDVTSPHLTGTTVANGTVQLLDSKGDVLTTVTAGSSGSYTVAIPGPLAVGSDQYSVDVIDPYGDVSSPSAAFSLTIVASPTTPAITPSLLPSESNGSPGGETTTLTSPSLVGTTLPGATVQLLGANGNVLNTTQATSSGSYEVQVPGPLGAGSYTYRVNVIDPYGDVSSPSATQTITVVNTPPPPPPSLVTVTSIKDVTNKKHQVTEILVTFSDAVNAAEADNLATYRLATAGKKGSFTAKNAKVIKLKSASYDAADNTVALTPKKAFALTKAVQLEVDGLPPSGLQDSIGRYIDGGHNGTAGGNAVAIISRGGVAIDAKVSGTARRQTVGIEAVVNALFERDELLGVTPNRHAQRGGRPTGP